METQPALQLSEFQKDLEKRVFVFQIVAIALLLGATLFLGIVLLLFFTEPGDAVSAERAETNTVPLISLVHLCMACGSYITAYFLYQYFVNPKRLTTPKTFSRFIQPMPEMSMEGMAGGLIYIGFIFRAALMEGTALFGLIVCLLGVLNGTIQNEPIYWLNLSSYVIFAGMILWTFPTKERLESIFQRRFSGQDQFLIPE